MWAPISISYAGLVGCAVTNVDAVFAVEHAVLPFSRILPALQHDTRVPHARGPEPREAAHPHFDTNLPETTQRHFLENKNARSRGADTSHADQKTQTYLFGRRFLI